MGKKWKKLWLLRKVEATKQALEIKEEKIAPAPEPAPVVEKKVEEKVVEKPKPKRSYKAKKNSTAKKKVKK
tara:strand:- start:267 stop:479 length:213 start_codon:yes stop_codon:yes gene_type:complete